MQNGNTARTGIVSQNLRSARRGGPLGWRGQVRTTMDPVNATSTPPTINDPLTAALARWRQQVERDLKGAPFEKRLVTRTPEGIALQPLYTRADLPADWDDAAQPGEAPFRRGLRSVSATAPARRLQQIQRADATAFNAALRAALMNGQDAVVVPGPGAEVGGWHPADLDDLRTALAGVDLHAVPVHFVGDDDPLPAAALLLAWARATGFDPAKLTGSVAVDVIASAARAGAAPVEWAAAFEGVAGWLKWTSTHAPALKSVLIDATVWSDAGATATQELAFALAALVDNLRELGARGLAPETVLAGLLVRFGVGPRFFMEIAKFRAWRLLLAKVLAASQADVQAAAGSAVHASTGRWNKTRLDAQVNILRATTEGLSAVLGGVDGVDIAAFDEPAGAPSPLAERIARNLHTLLNEEFGFAVPGDVAGGSWYVEKLTDDLARQAWKLFREVETHGGLRAALAEGWVQAQITGSVETRDRDYATRRSGLIGSNLFPNARDVLPAAMPTGSPRVKSCVSARVWPDCLTGAVAALREGVSVANAVRDGAKPIATVSFTPVLGYRAAAPFERLRAASAQFALDHGRTPQAFLARLGPVKQHKPRADFSAGFLAVAGFALTGREAHETAEAAAVAAIASGAEVVVICSTDETYPELVPPLAAAVKAANPRVQVVLAGQPQDAALAAAFRSAGVDEFIHVRADVPATLGRLLKAVGANL